eukprot:gnl/TRDRNA2_/TRDRNA2_203443_c0_seq1.p1 gnl/TRDRNA2_/TRDRNA2_203443_c0~~gnl/TRDRNA2_/TRDRNA2_203443_c0_seq1.p1  ORF type:complete len:381 (-),score=64.06 gnl/TRDRNA2_/TRDRNA2_203443_c0_seq1:226-1347(-)
MSPQPFGVQESPVDDGVLLEVAGCCDNGVLGKLRAASCLSLPRHLHTVVLMHRLTHREWKQRSEAVWALGRVGEKGNRSIIQAVATSLAHDADFTLDWYASWYNLRAMFILQLLCEKGDELVVAAAARVLCEEQYADEDAQESALSLLGEFSNVDDDSAISSIRRHMENGSKQVRCAALKSMQAVARSGSADVISMFVHALEDEDADVRLAAIEAIEDLVTKGEGSVVAGLNVCLHDADINVKQKALACLRAVAETGDRTVITELSNMLLESRSTPWLRIQVIGALGEIGDDADAAASVIGILATCAGDEHVNVRSEALLRMSILVDVCVDAGSTSWTSSVEAYANDPDDEVREWCSKILNERIPSNANTENR